MGEHWYDWFLPIKYSPCTRHDRDDCDYPLGLLVDRMRKEAGIGSMEEFEMAEKPSRQRKRRRSRRDKYGGDRERRHNEQKGNERDEERVEEGTDVLVEPGGMALR